MPCQIEFFFAIIKENAYGHFRIFSFPKLGAARGEMFKSYKSWENKFLENVHKMGEITFNIDASEKNKDTMGMDGKQI